ncbi:MAG: TolC family protein [Deltaproteobacteria bacterium]|nr:TolC family protein [Deltaproteobacteria bacterium]
MKIPLLSFGLALIFLLNGCSSALRTTAEYPPVSPLGKTVQEYTHYSEKTFSGTEITQKEDPIQKLNLDRALKSALLYNPDLAAYSLEIRALEASTLQAGLGPNPEIEVEVENFAGNSELGGFNNAETTLMLSQKILLGDKIKKRALAAALESDLAAWEYEGKRLETITKVKKAFTEVLAAKEKIKLNQKLLKVSMDFLANINRLIKAGKVNPAEASRARVIVSTIQMNIRSAKLALRSAKSHLASLWGSTYPNFDEVDGVLDSLQPVPPLEKFQTLLKQNPVLVRYEKKVEQKQAVIDVEKANAIPDVNVGAGFRRFNETDDGAFVAAVSIPIPIRDRNQGGIAEAKIRYTKTKRELAALETQLNSELSSVYNTLINHHHEVTTLKNEILIDAEKAFRMIKEGSMRGRFTMLDVLDAERTFFEMRSQYIRAITDFQIAKIEIEHLIAQEMATVEME